MSNQKFSYMKFFDNSKKTKKKKFVFEYETKRICECSWHDEIILNKFEECPRCKSQAYHLVIVLKTIRKEIQK